MRFHEINLSKCLRMAVQSRKVDKNATKRSRSDSHQVHFDYHLEFVELSWRNLSIKLSRLLSCDKKWWKFIGLLVNQITLWIDLDFSLGHLWRKICLADLNNQKEGTSRRHSEKPHLEVSEYKLMTGYRSSFEILLLFSKKCLLATLNSVSES